MRGLTHELLLISIKKRKGRELRRLEHLHQVSSFHQDLGNFLTNKINRQSTSGDMMDVSYSLVINK